MRILKKLFPPMFLLFVGVDILGQVVVREFKAFHCGPCKTLKKNVIDPVVEHYRWTGKVKWEVTLGQINSLDRPSSEKFHCLVREGAVEETAMRLLFDNPEATTEYLSVHLMVVDKSVDKCVADGLGNSFYLSELQKVKDAGIRFFPTLWINGRQVSTPTTPQQLINLIEGS